jgi:hypothetical protein
MPEAAFHLATTLYGNATLPFVISTGAQRSGEISVWMLFPGDVSLSLIPQKYLPSSKTPEPAIETRTT